MAFRGKYADVQLPSLPPTDLAYLAGLIDGEGTINVDACTKGKDGQYTTFRQSLVFCSTTPELIDWVWSRFPYGSKCTNRSRNRRWKRQHRILYTYHAARLILTAIRPYLVLKQPQADLVLSMPMSANRRWGYTPAIRQRQYELWMELRKIRGRVSGKEPKKLWRKPYAAPTT